MHPLARRSTSLLVTTLLAFYCYGGADVRLHADPAEKEGKELAGSVYVVPVGHFDTRLSLFGKPQGFVMFEAKENLRNRGCFFIRRLNDEGTRIRIAGTRDGPEGIGYNLTGEQKTIDWAKEPEAREWILELIPREKGGGNYLRVANGELKGWYLSFEEKEHEAVTSIGSRSAVFVKYWKAQLTPKPGHMSKIGFNHTPFVAPRR
jgi:hypothetical protein